MMSKTRRGRMKVARKIPEVIRKLAAKLSKMMVMSGM